MSTHICCVGGMVEETMHEATDHEFEPRFMRISPDGTFSTYRVLRLVLKDGPFSTGQPVPAGAPGTNGGRRPVLM